MKKSKKSWQEEIFINKSLSGKVVAICDEKIVESADSYFLLFKKIKNIPSYRFFFVPENIDKYRILTLKK